MMMMTMTMMMMMMMMIYRGPVRERRGGGVSHVTRLNFKTSRVGVYTCFTSLPEIERNFFVFVGILKRGDSDGL